MPKLDAAYEQVGKREGKIQWPTDFVHLPVVHVNDVTVPKSLHFFFFFLDLLYVKIFLTTKLWRSTQIHEKHVLKN